MACMLHEQADDGLYMNIHEREALRACADMHLAVTMQTASRSSAKDLHDNMMVMAEGFERQVMLAEKKFAESLKDRHQERLKTAMELLKKAHALGFTDTTIEDFMPPQSPQEVDTRADEDSEDSAGDGAGAAASKLTKSRRRAGSGHKR